MASPLWNGTTTVETTHSDSEGYKTIWEIVNRGELPPYFSNSGSGRISTFGYATGREGRWVAGVLRRAGVEVDVYPHGLNPEAKEYRAERKNEGLTELLD
ncbi:hypothetical protein CMO88_00775 [Candidatus Woesearchaeota archaeon]|nr:hypothetical protein [Candidatus Woesearchaeota archaeon]